MPSATLRVVVTSLTPLHQRRAAGDTIKESMRALKRRLSDVVYRALLADTVRLPNPTAPTRLT